MRGDIDVVQVDAQNGVTLGMPEDHAAAIGTACIARRDYFGAYDNTYMAQVLEEINSSLYEPLFTGETVDLSITWLEYAADATAWFARELERLEDPDRDRIDDMEDARDALRRAILEARVQLDQAPRDHLGPKGEA